MGALDNIRRFLTPGDFQEAAAESSASLDKFSPGVPIRPADGYSRTPRAHDFLTGYNIAARPRRNERVSFTTLQGIIEAYDVAQMAITHRIDSVRSFDWYLEPLDGVSGDTSEMVNYAKSILKSPDRELPFRAWLSKFLWDTLAYDAGTLYRMRNNAGKVIGLKVVDGTTIAPLIDYHGGRPTGEAPAFVQFAQGVPWNWLTQDDIIYIPFRPMPNTPYGKSPIESVLLNANTDLRFQNYFLSRFTEGTVPEGFAVSPESWSPDQISDFQEAWDAIMYGDESKKHQIKWVPGGTSFEWTRENTFDSEFSLFMMRKTAAAYHVTPADLGFTETVNLASSETQLDVQFRIGDLPLIQHVQEILSDFIQNDLGLPLQFVFNTGQEKDDKMLTASIHDMYIKNGVLSVSEVRQEVYGLQEPDGVAVPRFLMGGAGPIPLNVIRDGSGVTDPDTGSPMGTAELEATTYDVEQGLASNISPAGGQPMGAPGNTSASAREAAVGTNLINQESLVTKEGATAGVTTATGAVGNPMLSDEDEDEESREDASKAEDMVAKELAQFRRFVKARQKSGSWRDFKFDAIPEDDAKRLNTAARIKMEPLELTASLVVHALDTGRVLMIQRWLDPEDPHAGLLEFPGGHLEGEETFEEAAKREWLEEVGEELPEGSTRFGWRNFKGDHEAYVYDIDSEDMVVTRAKHDPDIYNPDDPNDPEEVNAEPIMWIDVKALRKNPLVRPEIVHDYNKIVAAVGDAVPLEKGWRDSANKVPQHRYDLQIVDYYAPIVAEALVSFAASLPITRVVESARNLVAKDAESDALRAKVRAMLGDVGDEQDIADAVRSVLTDGYVSGALGAVEQIGNVNASVARVTAGTPWDSWRPGSTSAAGNLRDGGLQAMLDDAGITIQSIKDNALVTVGNKIADGVAAGQPTSVIADAIEENLTAPYRAQMIAQTEAARAQSTASLNMYERAGADGWELVLSDGACEVCQEAAANGPYATDEFDFMPPIHPFCRCAATPLIGGGSDGGDAFSDDVESTDGGDGGWTGNTFGGFLIGFGAGLLGAAIYDHFTSKTEAAPADEEHPDEFEDGDGIATDLFTPLPGQKKKIVKSWDENAHPRDAHGRFANSDAFDAINDATSYADVEKALWSVFREEGQPFRTEGFGNRNLNLDRLKEMGKAFVRVRTAHPEAKVTGIEVRTMPANVGGRTETTIMRATGEVDSQVIIVNSKLVNEKDSAAMEIDHGNAHEAGWYTSKPDGVSVLSATIVHEYGHALDYSREGGVRNPIYASTVAREIADGGDSGEILRNQRSEYAKSNEREAVAEAFTDVTLNGDKASDLSKGITAKLLEGQK